MMRSVNEENAEETRKVQIVKSAISTLSFSELEAITHIFDEMDGKEVNPCCEQDCRPCWDYKICNRKCTTEI